MLLRHDYKISFVVALVATLALAGADALGACDPGTDLLITEFMASNASTLADEDGDYSDWIEIYDPCLPTVDLDGWYLTDDSAQLTKWRFPSVQLNRSGFLKVFASGKNRAIAGAQLHTSFKLSDGGEYLALVRPDGITIAHAFSPAYPPQYPDVSYGLPQSAAKPVVTGAEAKYHVPVIDDDALGTGWTDAGFDDAAWPSGPTGIGYASTGSGSFELTFYKANTQVPDLGTAEAVIADPALQTSVQTEQPATINYLNTGSAAHFAADLPFPGTQIGVNVDDFVVLVTGSIIIPTAGAWTFGVNSDDGFSLELSRQPDVFTSSFPGLRGASDTLATFNIPEPGAYAVRLVSFERGGGSGLEFFAAPGALASFSSAFDLVGDTAAGGLSVSDISSLIATDVSTLMQGVNASLWARIPFSVPDPGTVDLLTFRMAYEDGFVAFLNGVEVSRRNAPADVRWNSTAPADRPSEDAGIFEQIDLTDFVALLQPGTNMLAIHGLNEDPADDTFLVLPVLTTVGPTVTGAPAYFAAPTPGVPNTSGYPGVSGSPTFSRANGPFTDPFSLTVTAAAPGAVIRYTLNGSDPTETNGTVYSGAIAVANSTRIRARVFEPGLAPGPVITRFYVQLAADVLGFSSNLPIVVVDTFGGGISQTFSAETLTSIIPTTGSRAAITDAPEFAGPAGIRIRGSSSAGFPKKQYALETWDEYRNDLSVSFLGLPAESDWILHAPYSDKTLMRNVLAYKWSNDIDRYAVRTRFAEAFVRTASGPVSSSDYVGVYILMEKIKQDENRVNLVDLQPTDALPPEVTGGYIIKKDRLDPGDTGFLTSTGLRLAYVEPKEDEITTTQAAYLSGYLNQMESALYGPGFEDPVDGYAGFIDVDSFIDHHLLVELTKNIDGFRLSTFMFKDRGAKLNMGPIWDYNLSLGNANYNGGWLPDGWYHDLLGGSDYPWWPRLFGDPEFGMRYADRWYALRRGAFRTPLLLADIDTYTALLGESQARNYVRWPVLGIYVWPNWYIGTTYQEEIDWMKQWLTDRLVWMDGQFPAPPEFNRPGGPVSTGFGLEITAPIGVIYYTLDGSDPRLPGGEVSPSALVYSDPLVILELSVVRTRALDAGIWSAINEGEFVPTPPLYVNEVLPANVTGLADEQGDFDPWIELYNPFTSTANLAGLYLTDDPFVPDKWPLPPGATLCGGQRLIVWADAEPVEGPLHANFTLSAAGGSVWLFDAAGLALDSMTYPALGSNVSYGRDPDGSANLAQFVHPTPGAANLRTTTPILVNEYNGVAPTNFLGGTGGDVFFGRVLGNGGDWFELVVVEDHLDLRGFKVQVRDNSGATAATLTFTGASLLSDLRSGTIITVSGELPTEVSYAPAAGDWWINLKASALADGLYISNLNFSVSHQNTQITILDASGVVVFGPVGEGINPASGVGSDEVLKLEENPGALITAFSAYNDGTSSSFGAPNLWSAGAGVQDFSALRYAVLATCTTDEACIDGNPCTDDACVGGSCENTPNAAACDDGNRCTSGDTCANRICGGQVVPGCCFSDCDCDDANACTEGDSCRDGTCDAVPVVCDDGNPCTAEACDPSTGSCVFATSGLCGIEGTVYYYRDDRAPGSEPSAKGVPGVGIDQTQDATADATTDGIGAFTVGDLSGDLTVTTVAKFGNPRAADHNGAISSFDASIIGRAAAGLVILSPNQTIAADVTGDGTISAFDASFVGRFAAALVDHFDVATASGSDWKFLRCDAYVFPGDPGCALPAYNFTPISQLEGGANFHAILYGDVTGNWEPSAGFTAASVAASGDELAAIAADRQLASQMARRGALEVVRNPASVPAELAIERLPRPLRRGESAEITIRLDKADGILALDLSLTYDPARIAVVSVRTTGIGSDFTWAQGGTLGSRKLAAYGVLPLSGSGPLLTVTVQALTDVPRRAPLTVTAVANEGRVPLRVRQRPSPAPNSRNR